MMKSGREYLPLFVMATRKMHALVHVHLATANQSEIRKAYLVSVLSKKLGKKRPFVLQ